MIIRFLFTLATIIVATPLFAELRYSENIETSAIETGVRCTIKEQVSVQSGDKTYELVNLIIEDAKRDKDCQAKNFKKKATQRYIFITSADADKTITSQFLYLRAGKKFPQLDKWLDLKKAHTKLNAQELISYAELLPYQLGQYPDPIEYDFKYWSRSIAYHTTQVKTMTMHTGKLIERTSHQDEDQYTKECSLDGDIWMLCP